MVYFAVQLDIGDVSDLLHALAYARRQRRPGAPVAVEIPA
jgi:hypothetical protein